MELCHNKRKIWRGRHVRGVAEKCHIPTIHLSNSRILSCRVKAAYLGKHFGPFGSIKNRINPGVFGLQLVHIF